MRNQARLAPIAPAGDEPLPHEIQSGDIEPQIINANIVTGPMIPGNTASCPPVFQGQYAYSPHAPFPPTQPMLLYPPQVPVQPQGSLQLATRSEIQGQGQTPPTSGPKKGRKKAPRRSSQKDSGINAAVKRTLSEKDELTLIHYWRENYSRYAKSNKKTYAKQAAKHLNLTYVPNEPDKTPFTDEQVDYKLDFWLKKYKRVAKPFHDSGFGLQEGDPHTLKEVAEQKMKHFHVFHSFLSTRANINPPAILQTRREHGATELHVDQTYGQIPSADDYEVQDTGELSNEEDETMQIDDIEPGNPSVPGSSGKKTRSGLRKRKATDTLNGDSLTTKQKMSGAFVVDEGPATGNPGNNGNSAKTQEIQASPQGSGGGERTAHNSSSRFKIVDDMYANQAAQNESQAKAYAETVSVMKQESEFRKEEVNILKENAGFRRQEI